MPDSNYTRTATIAYVAPFVAYVSLLGLDRVLALPAEIFYPIRFVTVLLIILFVSRPFISLRPSFPVASIGVGIAVFLIWIGPDILFGYRHHWLFDNSLTGSAVSSAPDYLHTRVWFLVLRMVSTGVLVPILEELFWRGWLMRMLIHADFLKVPLGKYVPSVFWVTAILFASEHGAFWEVGLAAGIIYNWWIVRCKNLADCILAHAVTNTALGVYVLMAGQWQYWL